MTQSGHP